MKGKEVLFSHDIQNYSTPQYIFDYLNKEFNFTLDACADRSNHKCSKYYSEVDNGLDKSWESESVFINPPYKYTKYWVEKSYNEVKLNNCNCAVLLIPSRTDVAYYHDIIFPYASSIRFIRSRLKFSGNKNSAPFPSAIIVFNNVIYNPRIISIDLRN